MRSANIAKIGAKMTRTTIGTARITPIWWSSRLWVSSQTGKNGSTVPLTIIGAQKTSALRCGNQRGASSRAGA